MPGEFNVANGLAAVAACVEAGIERGGRGPRASALATPVGGRMERIAAGQGSRVIVDYAHKPDASTAALEALRPVTQGRLILVIGAGGDRDRGKRPLMGEIGARLADVVVVTDDNPRSEDPGCDPGRDPRRCSPGRRPAPRSSRSVTGSEAIRYAVRNAAAGDAVLSPARATRPARRSTGSIYPVRRQGRGDRCAGAA